MTAADQEAEEPVAGGGNGAVPAHIALRWLTVGEAARVLSISEVAVRKRLSRGSLTGLRVGRSWRVLLAGETEAESPPPARAPSPPDDSAKVLAQTTESLNVLVRDLQRQSLALAAQVGYLQSQLADAQKQVKLLAERNDATVEHAPAGPSPADFEAAQATIAGLRTALAEARHQQAQAPPPRRGWRFWRRR